MRRLTSKGRTVKESVRKPSFYEFNQNNSGGGFDYDDNAGISEYVIVEATSADEAISIAKDIGLYFDGDGDCSCCGNRWSDYMSDRDGTDIPMLYGKTLEDYGNGRWEEGWREKGKPVVYVHYLNGIVEGWG